MIEAILELESRIFNGVVRDKDSEITEIANEYDVRDKDLEPYFDLLERYKNVSLNAVRTIQKWCSSDHGRNCRGRRLRVSAFRQVPAWRSR